MKSFLVALLGAGVVAVLIPSSLVAGDPQPLIQQLPPDINMLTIVQVEDALQSTRAVREEWAKSADERFLSGGGGIPSWVKTLVVGSKVRLSEGQELWTASLATVADEITAQRIAQHEETSVDSSIGKPVVLTRRGNYVAELAPHELALLKPGSRQELAQWIAGIDARETGPKSLFLKDVSKAPGHLVVAMDLVQALEPVAVKEHLKLQPSLANNPERLDAITNLLKSIQGGLLTLTVEGDVVANLRFRFATPVGNNSIYLKEFFVDVMNHSGMAIEEFQRATFQDEGNTLRLSTKLGDESVRKIVSLVTGFPGTGISLQPQVAAAPPAASPPAANPPAAAPPSARPPVAAPPAANPPANVVPPAANPPAAAANVRDPAAGNATLDASKKYFAAVDKYLNDLTNASRRANSYAQSSTWHNNYAKRLEELDAKNVDPALVDYSQAVANEVRALARSLEGVAVQVNVEQQTLTYNAHYTPGWASVNIWGGVGYGESAVNWTSNLAEVRQKQADAVTAGAKQRDDIWQIINNQRTEIQRRMREKYGPDFGTGG